MEPDDDNTRTHIVLIKGTLVSHYRIISKIGAGGMGEVYLAEGRELNSTVEKVWHSKMNTHPQH